MILLVEDESAICLLVKRAFGITGKKFTLLEAVDGLEGLRLFEQHQDTLQLILLDLGLPGMTGEELFARMIALKPEIPIIVLSGEESEIAFALLPQKPACYLQKPFTPTQLFAAIHSILPVTPV
jgi:DNA-binding response OmpR family regulator